MKKLLFLSIVVLGLTTSSFAQNLVANASAFAEIQSQSGSGSGSNGAGVAWAKDMNFGSINVFGLTSGTGSVTIDPSSLSPATANQTVPATYSSNIAVGTNSPTIQPASFTVTGSPTSITITNSIPLTFGTHTIVVDNIKSNKTLVLAASGTKTLYVGGTMNLAAGQAVGGYANTAGLEVTIAY